MLKFEFGLKKEFAEVVCNTSASEGALENKTVLGQMVIQGTTKFKNTECTVKPETCKVLNKELIGEANIKSVVVVNANKEEEMYWEYTGKKEVGKTKEIFAEFTLQECEAKGPVSGTYFATGTAIATPRGATVEFLSGEAKNTLKTEGTKAAEYIGIDTLRMEKGEPLSLTTTSN